MRVGLSRQPYKHNSTVRVFVQQRLQWLLKSVERLEDSRCYDEGKGHLSVDRRGRSLSLSPSFSLSLSLSHPLSLAIRQFHLWWWCIDVSKVAFIFPFLQPLYLGDNAHKKERGKERGEERGERGERGNRKMRKEILKENK